MSLLPEAYLPYSDPTEFIVEWTDRIWVDRGVGLIRANYAEDAAVHSAYGTSVGQDPVIRGTLLRIATFPDRIGQAEDVVWEQRGDDGFLSSHRILSVGTHSGRGSYGPPTHRRFMSRAVANCLYVRGRMVREWLVRDEYGIVVALGLDPAEVARGLAFGDWQQGTLATPPVDPLASGESGPRPADHRDEAELVLELFERVWRRREYDRISEFVTRDVFCHTVSNRTALRPAGMVATLIDLLAPFPEADIEVFDVVTHDSPEHGGVRVAIQWLLRGTYSGAPTYGPLTGSDVRLLGASHFLVQHGRVVTEWRVHDDLAALTQIVHARGDAAE
jgi:hypothetical protein